MIEWVPVITLFVSFWQLGNKQILENVVLPLQSRNDIMRSGHFLVESVFEITTGSPNFIPFVALCCLIVFKMFKWLM
jgi:hypothetical protein